MASSSKPPSFLLYACIAHRTTILAEHSVPGSSSTSASSLASIILPKITHEKSQKLTFTHERLFVHCIADSPTGEGDDSSRNEPSSHNPLTYIVVASAEQGRRIPFAFLLEIKRKFLSTYPSSSSDFGSLPAYGCAGFNAELRSLMQTFNTASPSDSLAMAKRDIDDVRGIIRRISSGCWSVESGLICWSTRLIGWEGVRMISGFGVVGCEGACGGRILS